MQIARILGIFLALQLAACPALAQPMQTSITASSIQPLEKSRVALLNRLTWGLTPASAGAFVRQGETRFLETQLAPGEPDLPSAVRRQIEQMEISQVAPEDLLEDIRRHHASISRLLSVERRREQNNMLQRQVNRLANEAAQRTVLMALYSQNQLQERMTWFWMNHFNLHMGKHAYMSVLIPDYEQHTVRPRALGSFRELLLATMRHPAMLVYLDNTENHADRPDTRYAQTLLQTHTLGSATAYTKNDVTALAQILSGLNVNVSGAIPTLADEHIRHYRQQGVLEFDPNHHDFSDKHFLGHTIAGTGWNELEHVADILVSHPATARHISHKLAVYFVGDSPSESLIARLSERFLATQGDIAAILASLFTSAEFQASLLEDNFKDPMRYVMGSLRLLHRDGPPIVHAQSIVNWLRQLGQPLYGRKSPEGYPLQRSIWQGSGQMIARFNVARAIGGANPQFFQQRDQTFVDAREAPDRLLRVYDDLLLPSLGEESLQSLAYARNTHEWNTLLLSSPEFMNL